MILFDRHIEILLLDNNCVIVPGLGGFMTHHVSAQYYSDTQTYLPPLRQLGFNANIQINDSLLAQSYIETYDISYPEAIRRISEEVEEMKQILQNEGRCELNDIGSLVLNIEGKIEFEPCEAGILTPELYGLNSVDIKPLSITEKKNSQADTTNNDNALIAPLVNNIQNSDNNEDVTYDDDEEKTITIKVSTLKNIATIAASVVILFVCALPFGKDTRAELTESNMDSGILYNILPEELRSNTQHSTKQKISFHKANDNIAKETKNDTIKIQKETKPATPAQNAENNKNNINNCKPLTYYSIVLASQVTKNNAEEFVGKLKKAGYSDAKIVKRQNGLKVIYGQFETEREAYNFLHQKRTTDNTFKDGWIMKFQ